MMVMSNSKKLALVTLMFKLKLEYCWIHGYISEIDFQNSPPSFTEKGSLVKRFAKWKCLPLTLPDEIRIGVYSSSYE